MEPRGLGSASRTSSAGRGQEAGVVWTDTAVPPSVITPLTTSQFKDTVREQPPWAALCSELWALGKDGGTSGQGTGWRGQLRECERCRDTQRGVVGHGKCSQHARYGVLLPGSCAPDPPPWLPLSGP